VEDQAVQIENHFPFVIVVSTYDVGDYLYWVPAQTRNIGPCASGVIPAHDGGRCKIKIEIIDGPRTWVLDRPDDRVYADGETLTIGRSDYYAPGRGAHGGVTGGLGRSATG
jgi:hypothetical protein